AGRLPVCRRRVDVSRLRAARPGRQRHLLLDLLLLAGRRRHDDDVDLDRGRRHLEGRPGLHEAGRHPHGRAHLGPVRRQRHLERQQQDQPRQQGPVCLRLHH
ncbi:hypothetical protein BN1708_017391, partial [Verticillium longisporum]